MSIAHLSVDAANPELISRLLARIMGGVSLPFPPCPGAFIAFDGTDDGTAIEVYPSGTQVQCGPAQIDFMPGPAAADPVATHICITSDLSAVELLDIGAQNGWTARICNRGPFDCVEIWLENRVLIEALDPDMTADYRRNMSAAQWRTMFGLPKE